MIDASCQTEDLDRKAKFTETSIQTEEWEAQRFSESEEEEDTEEPDNGLDNNAKNLLNNMFLVNMETYGEEDEHTDLPGDSAVYIEEEEDEGEYRLVTGCTTTIKYTR